MILLLRGFTKQKKMLMLDLCFRENLRHYTNQKKEPFNLNYSWFVSKELDVNS